MSRRTAAQETQDRAFIAESFMHWYDDIEDSNEDKEQILRCREICKFDIEEAKKLR